MTNILYLFRTFTFFLNDQFLEKKREKKERKVKNIKYV